MEIRTQAFVVQFNKFRASNQSTKDHLRIYFSADSRDEVEAMMVCGANC